MKMALSSKILVVDDVAQNVKLLDDLLSGKGYTVLKAFSGPEALVQLEKGQPDLILLDVMMPEMSGYEVCRKVRENPSTTLLPVIMVTALDPLTERVKGIDAGADDFISKPVNMAELLARVRSLLRIKALHEKVQTQAEELAEVIAALGNISHDAKNFLTPVVFGADLLRDEMNELLPLLPASEEERAAASRKLCNSVFPMFRNGVRRLQDMVAEIANCAKGITSVPNFQPCCVHTVIASVVKTLSVVADEKRIFLRTEGLEALPPIVGDESRLYNAFYNLINNAIPEVPAGGAITVYGCIDPEASTICVSVIDTGRGMSAEVRGSLFGTQAISHKAGGTGLGTKIVKDVVRAHNGEIRVESEEGKGTAFHIRLPISLESSCDQQQAAGR
jgi:DNA-binding response OmpR family regulator